MARFPIAGEPGGFGVNLGARPQNPFEISEDLKGWPVKFLIEESVSPGKRLPPGSMWLVASELSHREDQEKKAQEAAAREAEGSGPNTTMLEEMVMAAQGMALPPGPSPGGIGGPAREGQGFADMSGTGEPSLDPSVVPASLPGVMPPVASGSGMPMQGFAGGGMQGFAGGGMVRGYKNGGDVVQDARDAFNAYLAEQERRQLEAGGAGLPTAAASGFVGGMDSLADLMSVVPREARSQPAMWESIREEIPGQIRDYEPADSSEELAGLGGMLAVPGGWRRGAARGVGRLFGGGGRYRRALEEGVPRVNMSPMPDVPPSVVEATYRRALGKAEEELGSNVLKYGVPGAAAAGGLSSLVDFGEDRPEYEPGVPWGGGTAPESEWPALREEQAKLTAEIEAAMRAEGHGPGVPGSIEMHHQDSMRGRLSQIESLLPPEGAWSRFTRGFGARGEEEARGRDVTQKRLHEKFPEVIPAVAVEDRQDQPSADSGFGNQGAILDRLARDEALAAAGEEDGMFFVQQLRNLVSPGGADSAGAALLGRDKEKEIDELREKEIDRIHALGLIHAGATIGSTSGGVLKGVKAATQGMLDTEEKIATRRAYSDRFAGRDRLGAERNKLDAILGGLRAEEFTKTSRQYENNAAATAGMKAYSEVFRAEAKGRGVDIESLMAELQNNPKSDKFAELLERAKLAYGEAAALARSEFRQSGYAGITPGFGSGSAVGRRRAPLGRV